MKMIEMDMIEIYKYKKECISCKNIFFTDFRSSIICRKCDEGKVKHRKCQN